MRNLAVRGSSAVDFYRDSLVQEYDQFRQKLNKMGLAMNRQDWQPQVMSEKHWPKERLSRMARKLQEYPELNVNCAVEYIKYDRYMDDDRFVRHSFPQIIKHTHNPLLIVFYPRAYNAGSLTLELSQLEEVSNI